MWDRGLLRIVHRYLAFVVKEPASDTVMGTGVFHIARWRFFNIL